MDGPGVKRERRMPVQQLSILALCRFSEPVVLTSIFPYMPEMIEFFGVPRNDVAKWAGIASSAFAITQCFTALFWGRLADRCGRKLVILCGLATTMLSSLIWGLSTNLGMAIFARALSGVGNGNVGILRTVVGELVPWKEFQPRAFSLLPVVYNVGSMVGPIIGGSLANPTRRRPGEPATDSLFSKFPFLLPNLVIALIFMVSIFSGLFFLHETRPGLRHRPDLGIMLRKKIVRAVKRLTTRLLHLSCVNTIKPTAGNEDERQALVEERLRGSDSNQRNYQSISREEAAAPARKVHTEIDDVAVSWAEVLAPQPVLNVLAYTLLGMHTVSFDQLLPVFLHHTRLDEHDPKVQWPFRFGGGYGLSTAIIGQYYALFGAFSLLFQFMFYPPLAKKLGVLHSFRMTVCMYPIVYGMLAFGVLMPNEASRHAYLVFFLTVKSIANTISFPSSFILMTNSCKTSGALSALNSLATSTVAIGRTAAPFIAGQLFSYGVKRNFILMPFWVTTMLATVTLIPSFFMVEGTGIPDEDDGDDEVEDSTSQSFSLDRDARAPVSGNIS